MKPRLLDLFCGAGGCSEGYARAGFEVVGVDIRPQPNYPFEFVQADALELVRWVLSWDRFDPIDPGPRLGHFVAVHASPPCQAYSGTQRIGGREHPDLVGPTRELLDAAGLPYVIENVAGAPLRNPAVLEGQMFDGLRVVRPRYFETNWPLDVPLLRLSRPRQTKMGRAPRDGEYMHVVGNFSDVATARKAMGIEWMTRDELAQAVPPAFTEFIGSQLLAHIERRAA